MDDFSFMIPPAAIVGIIGGNGVGKTTLFRMITGQEKPDAGTLRVGETVKFAYVDQSRDALDPKSPSGRRSPMARTKSSWWAIAK